MSRPSPLAELLHRVRAHPVRWALPAAGLALAPKCLLCLAAYAGVGTLLGLAGPEICGAAPGDRWSAPVILTLAGALGLLLLAGWWLHRRSRAVNPPLPPTG